MASVPSFPRIDRLAGRAGQSILHAMTPRTGEPQGAPAPQSFSDYFRSQLAAFDPRTPAGAFNIAAMFVPGPGRGGGGKFVGELTRGQKDMLKQLNNVTGGQKGKRIISEQGQGTRVPYLLANNDVPISIDFGDRTSQFNRIPGIVAHTHPESGSITDLFGYSHGNPGEIQHELLGGNQGAYGQGATARTKLGWDEYGFPAAEGLTRMSASRNPANPGLPNPRAGIDRADYTPTLNQIIMDALHRYNQQGRGSPNPWDFNPR